MDESNPAKNLANSVNGTSKKHMSDSTARRRVVTRHRTNHLQKPPPRKPRSPIDRLTLYIIDNQIKLSLYILGLIYAVHFALPPSPNSPSITDKLIWLQYKNPESGLYKKGPSDFYHVFYWIVVFTLLRDATMQYVFIPCAKYGGVKTYKGFVRFAEQAWLMVYYTAFWLLGMYLNHQGPHWMNFKEMWTDWPVFETTGLFKLYYLAQLAFWLQQIFVLHIEDRRKDHFQMFAHHIITSALIVGSYQFHLTRVGNTILCAMDVVDILLPAAKILRYLGCQKMCDFAFGVFLVTWVISRHVVYVAILWSVYHDAPYIVPYSCVSVDTGERVPQEVGISALSANSLGSSPDRSCFTRTVHMIFFYLLAMLQVITLVWLYMIGKVAYKVVAGTGAEDTRSDDEEGNEEESEEEPQESDKAGVTDVDMILNENGSSEPYFSLKRADSGYLSGTATTSSLMMNGNHEGSGSVHKHISAKLN